MPHVSMDDGFFGEKDSHEQVTPVLVTGERRHAMTWTMPVPLPWVTKRAAKFIDLLERKTITLRCDNEPAVRALAREIAQARQEGKSDRAGESASHRLHGEARPERRRSHWNTATAPRCRLAQGYSEFVAHLVKRCDVGSDGIVELLGGALSGAARLAAADERINRALAEALERHVSRDAGSRGNTENNAC